MKGWQKVILKNYGVLSAEKIASVIGTDADTVREEARRLGLSFETVENICELWRQKGFVTVIRSNWDVLDRSQIAFLLDMSENELDTLLTEYDFLDVKLGKKPQTSTVKYFPLSQEEKAQTRDYAALIKNYSGKRKALPFDFYSNGSESRSGTSAEYIIPERFTSCYSANYSGALLDNDLSDFSEAYLRRLSATGTNGIWISEMLRNLSPFPFDPNYEGNYSLRRQNLNKLIARCSEYGIFVYLYLNEPRSLPSAFFEDHPHLKGQKTNDGYCLCTSIPAVKEYLYNAVKDLAANVPELKAVMTITMSENPTHCNSVKWDGISTANSCPLCKSRMAEETAAEINNIIYRGLTDGNGYTKLIANLWGWSAFMGYDEKQIKHGIDLLYHDIDVLCVSEYSKRFIRGGVESEVIDYSISVTGPSDITVKTLEYAKIKGHGIWAKVQVNNSWECSAVPYIPCFGLMEKHISALKKLDLGGLMLGWSLGGYPGGALPFVNSLCTKDGRFDPYEDFGEQRDMTKKAVECFDRAFAEFPFSISSLYFGGQTLGPANLWSLIPDRKASTMVCFTYDDYEKWTDPYGIDVYISQYKKLNEKWLCGLEAIEKASGNDIFEEFKRCAQACYIHFKSTENLAVFSKHKQNMNKNREILKEAVRSETNITAKLLELIRHDAKIGFEMTNHYYYNENTLYEKLVCLHEISKNLDK